MICSSCGKWPGNDLKLSVLPLLNFKRHLYMMEDKFRSVCFCNNGIYGDLKFFVQLLYF